MRIALVSPLIYPSPPPFSGGTERVVHDLGEALVARGHEVTVYAAEGSATSGELVSMGPSVLSVEDTPPGYAAAREALLLERVRKDAERYDIVHCHTEFMHAPVLGPDRWKSLTTIHWRADEEDRQVFLEGFPDLPVVAISQAQAETFPSSARLEGVVHHGMPPGRYNYGDGSGGYAAFLGRMTDQKGPDRAIRAAREAGLPIKLAGDIDIGNPDYFETQVKPLLGPEAEYIGPIGDREKQRFLGEAKVFAMPIEWPEPFGLVMIEAMACGTPIAASPYGAAPEIVGTGAGALAPLGRFADALREASGYDRQAVRNIFEARFTSDRMAAEYEAIYRKIAERTG
jgi:glycosyltransferase involved in cell wall biosynthesis